MLVLLAASSLALGASQSHAKGKAQGNKAGLESVVGEFLDAVKATNLDKIKSYYAADYTFTGPDGKIISAEGRLGQMKGGSNVVSFTDVKVRVYGGTGVANGLATNKSADGSTYQTRFTQTWAWQGGRWRLVASQVTRVE
jgi:ketosteroid isomerase-like protein